MKKLFKQSIFLLALAVFSGCKMDIVNPNGPTDAQVVSTREGLITYSIGMKQNYAASAFEALAITTGGTTREVKGIATFTNVLEIEAGGSALPTFNGNVLGVWLRMNRVMGMADDIIASAPTVLATDNAMRSGVVAHAHLFKAMAIGGLATAFEQVPTQTNKAGGVTFVPRQQGLLKAIELLEQAAALLAANAPSTEFNTRVLGANFNLLNCINAYLARYNMMAGRYAQAIAAANLVPLSSASQFNYDGAQTVNPLFNQLRVVNSFSPRDNFGLPAGMFDAADGRLAFYFQGSPVTSGSDVLRTIRGFAQTNSSPIPVYLPDEMRLIKAEAILRSGGLVTDALAEINAVRQQSSGDVFGVHANLPAYSGSILVPDLLLEVYKQRCAELYLSGLRLEDSRRFGRTAPPNNVNPVPTSFERNRNFYPYPDQERLNNPNTPADPAI
ncbi:putative outer membrane starch-binding protein [Lacibacter cauensis]|uniref:Putative outer membrane starch-binding protein n=1 Tax=Lacibacter cauensis TaxID=510947 RepID=A0A562SG14_9BACT|nr:RagB/SusD family nutrient uptake outer membrane protein [Lacibacter cauensis]TWI80232.1 putative outer membrane starch-binding protein [Lacibacter cauensis]